MIFYFKVGQKTFPILCDLVQNVVTVNDAEMAEGCRLVAERMKVFHFKIITESVTRFPQLKIG